jgi:hypothetical protein
MNFMTLALRYHRNVRSFLKFRKSTENVGSKPCNTSPIQHKAIFYLNCFFPTLSCISPLVGYLDIVFRTKPFEIKRLKCMHSNQM